MYLLSIIFIILATLIALTYFFWFYICMLFFATFLVILIILAAALDEDFLDNLGNEIKDISKNLGDNKQLMTGSSNNEPERVDNKLLMTGSSNNEPERVDNKPPITGSSNNEPEISVEKEIYAGSGYKIKGTNRFPFSDYEECAAQHAQEHINETEEIIKFKRVKDNEALNFHVQELNSYKDFLSLVSKRQLPPPPTDPFLKERVFSSKDSFYKHHAENIGNLEPSLNSILDKIEKKHSLATSEKADEFYYYYIINKGEK